MEDEKKQEKYTMQLNTIKAEIEKKAFEVRARQEEITKWVSIDRKIAELKSLQAQFEEAKKRQEEAIAKKEADAEKKIQEANIITEVSIQNKTEAQKDMDDVVKEKTALRVGQNNLKIETEQQTSKIAEEKAGLINEQMKLEALRTDKEKKTEALVQQEQKTQMAVETLNNATVKEEEKAVERKALQETQQAELNSTRQELEKITDKNEVILKETTAEKESLEATKNQNQNILDQINIINSEIETKKKEIASMLNRQADTQIRLDKWEQGIENREKLLKIEMAQRDDQIKRLEQLLSKNP